MRDDQVQDDLQVQHHLPAGHDAPGRTGPVVPSDPGESAKALLGRVQAEFMEAAGRVNRHGGFSAGELNDLKLLLKEGKHVRNSPPAAIQALASQYQGYAEELRHRAEGLEAVAEASPALEQTALTRRSDETMRPAPPAPARAGTTLYPDAAPADRTAWGEKAAATPQPVYRTVIGHTKPNKSEEDAHVRAALLAPVLTGALSPVDAAKAWKRKFRDGVLTPEDALALRDIPEFYRRKYRNLSPKTLCRWRREVEEAESDANRQGLRRPPVWQCLLHTYPSGADHPHCVRTPAVVKKATALFKENKDWSAARVADHLRETAGYTGSERSIQRTIAEEITDVERATERGGSAATDVMIRTRLLRESPYPNHTWTIDHSFIQQEIVELDYIDQVEDFDFSFQFAVARTTPSGSVELRRTSGLWMSAIMDASTRRILHVRVWDHHPNTATTLLALREAMMQYGVPEILYSDNGSDFKSGDTARALQAAGVRQIFSLPYSPEGRGKIERLFRTIKERVLASLEGYHGGRHQREWATEGLLTLEEVENVIWTYVDRVFNHGRKHKRTERVPAEHYDELVGAGRLRGLDGDGHFLGLLLVAREVVKRSTGFVLNGRTYWGGMLSQVTNGSNLFVHFDPYRPETVYVSAPAAGGALEFLCVAEEYGGTSGTPDIVEVHHLEAEARRHIHQARQERDAGRRKMGRLRSGREEGKALGVGLAEEVLMEKRALDIPRRHAALTPGGGTSTPEVGGASTQSGARGRESTSDSTPNPPASPLQRRSSEHKDGDVVVTLFDL